MAGGLLQLAAFGESDAFLMQDPMVTLFKTVFRRHTSFSIEDIDLVCQGQAVFGGNTRCKILKHGDLLGKITAEFDMPEVQVGFQFSKEKEIQILINQSGFTIPLNPDGSFNFQLFLQETIDRISALQFAITQINTIDPASFPNSELYHFAVIDLLMSFDTYNVVYQYLKSKYNNGPATKPTALSFSTTIINDLYDYLVNIITPTNELKFLSLVEFTAFNFQTGVSSTQAFLNGIHDQLVANPEYTLLDGYKTMINDLNNVNPFNFNGIAIQKTLINDIESAILFNPQLVSNVLDSIIGNNLLVIYENTTQGFGVGMFTSETSTFTQFDNLFFQNLSTISPQPILPNLFEQVINKAVKQYITNIADTFNILDVKGQLDLLAFDLTGRFFVAPNFNVGYFNTLLLSYLDSIYNMLSTFGDFGVFFPAVTALYNALLANTNAEIFTPAVVNLINTTFAPPDNYFMYAFMRNPTNTSQGFVQQFITLINTLPLTPNQRSLDLALMNNFVYVGPVIDNIDTYVNPGNIDVPLNFPPTNPPREFNQELQIWNVIDYIAQVNFQQLYSHKLLNPATLLYSGWFDNRGFSARYYY